MKQKALVWNLKLFLGLVFVGLVSIGLVVGGDLFVSEQVFTKPTSLTTKVTLDGESYIVASDLVNCNSGYCSIIVDGKSLKSDSANLELRFKSKPQVDVTKISVYTYNIVPVTNDNVSCTITETIINEVNQSSYDKISCENNPFNTYKKVYKWFELPVYQDSDGYYSSMPFFEDETFKVEFVVKNVLGKSIKYDVGIGANILDPLINSSSLYSTNGSWTLDYNSSLTTANVTSSGINLAQSRSDGIIGLNSYYSFENNVLDSHNKSNHLTDFGTDDINGKVGQARKFVRENSDYINFSTNTTMHNLAKQDFSISFWMSNNLSETSNGRVFYFYNTNTGIQLMSNSGQTIYFLVNKDGANTWERRTDAIIPANTFTNIVVVWNNSGNTAEIYKDGVIQSVTNAIGDVAFNGNGAVLGKRMDGEASSYFGGSIDEFAIFDKKLNQTEINQLYNSGNGQDYNQVNGELIYNSSNNLFYSKEFTTAVSMNNFSVLLKQDTVGGLFNNTFNVSCDGTGWVSINTSNLVGGTSYSAVCPVIGDKLQYIISLNGNTTNSSSVTQFNISFDSYASHEPEFVIGVSNFNLTPREVSYQQYTWNLTYNTTAISSVITNFWFDGLQYATNQISSVNNGTTDFNITTYNASLILPLVNVNTTSIQSFWNYTFNYANTTVYQNVVANDTQTVSWASWVNLLSINNTPRETSSQDYNFSITALEDLIVHTGILEIDDANNTVLNTSNTYGMNYVLPLVETNTTNITIVPYLNVTYGGITYIRTYTAQDQEISYAYWINSLSINNTPVETSRQSYNFSMTMLEELASIIGLVEINLTNYSMSNSSNVYGQNWTLPLTDTNTTNITIRPYANVSYGGLSYLRSFSSQDQEISWAYWINNLIINNSVKETSRQENNFTITSLENTATLIGLLQFNNTNYSVTNTSSNYGLNVTIPLVNTNTTNITTKPYLNISYGGISLLRSFGSQDQEISWAYYVNETNWLSDVIETTNQSYLFSIFAEESTAILIGFIEWNGTNQTGVTNVSNDFTFYKVVPLVEVNRTNITLKPYLNVTYGDVSSVRTNLGSSQTIGWGYNITSLTGNATIFEGEYSNISMTILNISNGFAEMHSSIEWNGTNYSVGLGADGVYRYLRATDLVSALRTNLTIRGFLNLTYGGISLVRTVPSIVQTVLQLGFDNCSVGSIELINYSFFNEKTKGDAVYVDLFGFSGNFHSINSPYNVSREYNTTFQNISFFKFCAIVPAITYVGDVHSYWQEAGFDTREYHAKNAMINQTVALRMYMLDTTNSTKVTITVVDGSDIEQQDIYAYIYDHNIINGTDTLLGSEMTDINGEVVFNLDVTDKYYVFRFMRDGTLLLTTDAQKLTQTAYTFRLVATVGSSFNTYHDIVSRTTRRMAYDNTTETVSFYYNDATRLTSSVCMDTYLINNSNASIINSQCSSASSANITYVLPYASSEYRTYAYCYAVADGRRYPFSDRSTITDFANLYALGLEGMFFGTLFILVYAGIGFFTVKKPVMGVLLAMIGFFACMGLGYFWVGTAGFMAILFVSIILFVKLKD